MPYRIKLTVDENQETEQKLPEFFVAHPNFEISEFDTANTLAKRINEIFLTVGIPAHIKGYQYLREAVKLTIEQPRIVNSVTKQLYPSVAENFKTTPAKVERSIRQAIQVGWNRGKFEDFNERPTNAEVVALVADKLLIDGVATIDEKTAEVFVPQSN